MKDDFTLWWRRVIARLYEGGIDDLPEAKPVDREAFDAGMVSDEWAWVYYTADLDPEEIAAGPDVGFGSWALPPSAPADRHDRQ